MSKCLSFEDCQSILSIKKNKEGNSYGTSLTQPETILNLHEKGSVRG